MELKDIENNIHPKLYSILESKGIKELRPSQTKAIENGLFEEKNLLVCTPTASGKTMIAELAMVNSILNDHGKAIYIVPLKALANEKYHDFKEKYGNHMNVGISIGDLDSPDPNLKNYDLILTTSEKLDSLIRHEVSWLKDVGVIVVDEVHLLNDISRGPTLEILLTILRSMLKKTQYIYLSATIGNENELAGWLDANLIHDTWRPVELKKGVYHDGKLEFHKTTK